MARVETSQIRVRKDPTLAGLLSFLIVGAGQVYVGQVGRGIGMFILSLFMGLLMVLSQGLLFFLPLIVWIWSITDAVRLAKEVNAAVEREARAEAEAAERGQPWSSHRFVEALRGLALLRDQEILDENEYQRRKGELIDRLRAGIEEEPVTFLGALVPLKEQGLLTGDEIARIKGKVWR